MRKHTEFDVDTDKGDIVCIHNWARFISKNYIGQSESKLVKMVDELDLWTDIGGSLEVDGET